MRHFSFFLRLHVPLQVVLDSKDLCTSLLTKLNSVDKSYRMQVNCICFYFERRTVARIIWMSGKLNLADPGTQSDKPLGIPLELTLLDAHSFEAAEACDADRPLG